MGWFTPVSLRSYSFALLNHLGKIVVILTFMAGASGMSSAATTTLSRVSCGSNAYRGAGTDACSVYLAAKTRTRTYVALSSNNSAVAVPSGVIVKPGAISTGFNATVASVT